MARRHGRSNLEVSIAMERGSPQAVRRDPKMCDELAALRAAKSDVKEKIIRRLRH